MPDPDAAERILAATATLDGTGRQPVTDLPLPRLRRQHAHLTRAVRDLAILTAAPPHDDAWTQLGLCALAVDHTEERGWLTDSHQALRKTLQRLLDEVQP